MVHMIGHWHLNELDGTLLVQCSCRNLSQLYKLTEVNHTLYFPYYGPFHWLCVGTAGVQQIQVLVNACVTLVFLNHASNSSEYSWVWRIITIFWFLTHYCIIIPGFLPSPSPSSCARSTWGCQWFTIYNENLFCVLAAAKGSASIMPPGFYHFYVT